MTAEISLTGDVGVRVDGQRLVPERRGAQVRLTFAMLVLERARGVGRDDLVDALWPLTTPPKAKDAQVRNLVSSARKPLTDAFGARVLRSAESGRYALALPDTVVVDVEEADRLIDLAQARLAAGDAAGALDAARGASERAGAPFLPDVECDWADSRRARLHATLLDAHECASTAALRLGDTATATAAARDAVDLDPVRESAYRCLMAAHRHAGNRAAAEAAYAQLTWTLTTRGLQPAPETVQAFHDLFAEIEPPLPDERARRPPTTAPFVGRTHELATLDAAWARARGGSGHLVLVTGEAGIGKTRLALEAARRASHSDGRLLRGRCDPEQTIRYQPFAEALHAVVTTAPDTELPLAGTRRAELAAIVPALDDERPPGAPVEQARLFDTVTTVFRALVDNQPLVLALDDLHWADLDTMLLLRHLLRATQRCRLLVVATARDHEMVGDHRLGRVLRPLAQDGLVHSVPLGGLDEDAVEDLVAHMRGDDGPRVGATAPRLVAETAGNPFFLVQLLAADRPADQPVPETVADLVAERIGGLDASTTALLRAGVVVGTSFPLDVSARVAQLDEAAALDAADAALASGLVVEEPHGRYRFTHDIARQALDQRLSAVRRRALHRRTADAIEELHSGDPAPHAAVLAHHAAQGAEDGDPRAVRWARLAARQAEAAGARAEAARLLRQARRHLPPDDDALTAEVLVELGVTLVRPGGTGAEDPDADGADELHHDGEDALVEGATLARRADLPAVAARAALDLAERARHRPGAAGRALALVDTVLDTTVTPDSTHARLLVRRSELRGTPVPPPPVAMVTALTRAVDALAGPDRLDERHDLAADLTVLADAAGDPAGRTGRTAAAHARTTVAALRGRRLETDAGLAELRTLAAHGDRDADALVARRAGAVAAREGRFADAATADPAQSLVVAWLRGTLAGADIAAQNPAEHALVAVERGDHDRARLLLRGIALGIDDLPHGDAWLHAAAVAALAATQLGDAALATGVRDLLAPYAGLVCGAGCASFAGVVVHHLGCLSAVSGDRADAERHLEQAIRRHTGLGAGPWVALSRHALARTLAARGRYTDRQLTVDLHEDATRMAARLGMRTLGP